MGADDYNLETDYGIALRHKQEERARQEYVMEQQADIIRLIKSQDPKIAAAYKELDENRIEQRFWNYEGTVRRGLKKRELELEAIINGVNS